MKHLWFHIGALAVTAAACACLFWRNRASRQKDDAQQALLLAIAAGISANAAIFDGLYESLYLAAHDERQLVTDAYEEWCERAAQVENEDFRAAFSQLFSKNDLTSETLCRRKMALLLSCVEGAGISRERESGVTFLADEQARRAYLTVDGSELQIGKAYTVLKAAWTRGNQVIELGMLLQAATKEGGVEA